MAYISRYGFHFHNFFALAILLAGTDESVSKLLRDVVVETHCRSAVAQSYFPVFRRLHCSCVRRNRRLVKIVGYRAVD